MGARIRVILAQGIYIPCLHTGTCVRGSSQAATYVYLACSTTARTTQGDDEHTCMHKLDSKLTTAPCFFPKWIENNTRKSQYAATWIGYSLRSVWKHELELSLPDDTIKPHGVRALFPARTPSHKPLHSSVVWLNHPNKSSGRFVLLNSPVFLAAGMRDAEKRNNWWSSSYLYIICLYFNIEVVIHLWYNVYLSYVFIFKYLCIYF